MNRQVENCAEVFDNFMGCMVDLLKEMIPEDWPDIEKSPRSDLEFLIDNSTADFLRLLCVHEKFHDFEPKELLLFFNVAKKRILSEWDIHEETRRFFDNRSANFTRSVKGPD